MTAPLKPAVLITRAVFPEVVARLREHFDVETHAGDVVWPQAELIGCGATKGRPPTALNPQALGAAGPA